MCKILASDTAIATLYMNSKCSESSVESENIQGPSVFLYFVLIRF